MQRLTNGQTINVTTGDVIGVLVGASPVGLATSQAEGLSTVDPDRAKAAGTEGTLVLATAAAGPLVKGAAGATTTVAESVAAKVVPAVKELTDGALDKIGTDALLKAGGVIERDGVALLDMSQLSTAQKGVAGELFGPNTAKQIVPDGTRIGRIPAVGETGIDDLYKVTRPDVDYIVIEYKFDKSTLGSTVDGKQMSDPWLRGDNSGYNRILESVGDSHAEAVTDALRAGRVEKWVIRTRPDGSTEVQVLDAMGKPKSVDTSKVLPPSGDVNGAKP